jgi:hypothetical protein
MYIMLSIVISIAGMWVSGQLQRRFRKYNQMPLQAGLSGAEVARNMLRDYGVSNVKIVEGRGTLTDHYNPVTRTVSLSPAVFHGRSVASAAVAAHECGHAVQHAEAYSFLQLRSTLVPIVNFAAKTQQYLLMMAILMFSTFPALLLITIIAFGITTIFSFITLPVEFDASKRALAWLNRAKLAHGPEYEGAKDALHWAAMTYVAAAMSSLIILLFLIIRYATR